jgi:dihydrofolate synthase/folylpolyglutamate synthase
VERTLTSYRAALEYLFARTGGGFKFGLERTAALLTALGNPQRRFAAVHIAGTNGKGSSAAVAEAVLRAKGLRVGKYTSPHLVDFRERILVDGRPIFSRAVSDFVERWTPLVEEVGATFFEATTAMAFDWFARAEVDVAVVEAGLGGRLDATNVLTPRAAGVTSIGLDHTEYLGETFEAIADEKAGIFKRGVPAVIGEPEPAIAGRLAGRARAAGAAGRAGALGRPNAGALET